MFEDNSLLSDNIASNYATKETVDWTKMGSTLVRPKLSKVNVIYNILLISAFGHYIRFQAAK